MARTINAGRFRFLGGELRLEYPDLNKFERKVLRRKANAHDLRPVFTRFKPTVERQIDASFRGERGSRKWPRLSENYRQWKQRNYPGKTKLVLTGRYRRGFRIAAFPRQLRVLNNVRVSGHNLFDIHQFGVPFGVGSRLPARPVLFMTQRDRQHLRAEIRRHIRD